MRNDRSKIPALVAGLSLAIFLFPIAQLPAPAAAEPATGSAGSVLAEPADAALTPEERAERESRKSCKVDICRALHAKPVQGQDIACDIVKSWRKEQVSKLVAKLKVSWPFGPVRCQSAVKLKGGDLANALSSPKMELRLATHTVSCTVEREKEAATEISFDFAPNVTFENGKATKAQMNWGKINAPPVIKSGLWTATAADNTVNILSGTLVEDINSFVSKKCDEVKEEWAARQ